MGQEYIVDPVSGQCSCPDTHRRGKGYKRSILCWASWRAHRPATSSSEHDGHRRCDAKPKITRHEPNMLNSASDGQVVVRDGGTGDFEHAGDVAARVFAGVTEAASKRPDSYEERECSRCFEGLTYDGQHGEWVAYEVCEGSGRTLVLVYPPSSVKEVAGCSPVERSTVDRLPALPKPRFDPRTRPGLGYGGRHRYGGCATVLPGGSASVWVVGDSWIRRPSSASASILLADSQIENFAAWIDVKDEDVSGDATWPRKWLRYGKSAIERTDL